MSDAEKYFAQAVLDSINVAHREAIYLANALHLIRDDGEQDEEHLVTKAMCSLAEAMVLMELFLHENGGTQ